MVTSSPLGGGEWGGATGFPLNVPGIWVRYPAGAGIFSHFHGTLESNFVMSVCSHGTTWLPTGRILMKTDF
jgi:hypothetical protein